MSRIGNVARALLGRRPQPEPKTPAIGLALGGGFARGLAHIGVLRVLEEEQIPIRFIAGTSVGALVGAAYCSGVTTEELQTAAAQVRFKDFARYTLSRYGFCSNDRMIALLERTLKVKTFEELRIPLAVTATDFLSGEPVVFRSGSLVETVRASCAYPGMFLPVEINGRLYMDGMLAHSVPAQPLRETGAERVIAVYLAAHWVGEGGPRHVFEVIGHCLSIAQARMCSIWQAHADVVLQPPVAGFAYDSFERAPELVALGEEAARAALPQIRSWLPQAKEKAPRAALPALAPGVAEP